MDATYRTMKKALPIFFMCVHTNVRYVPVCSFIVQNEQMSTIAEALSIIRDHMLLAGFKFKCFMVDKCLAQSQAIEAVFPGVYK